MKIFEMLKTLTYRLQRPKHVGLEKMFFFRTKIPVGDSWDVGKRTLMVVRVSGLDPYLAVADYEWGARIAVALGVERTHEVIRGTDLSDRDYFDFLQRKIVLLKSTSEIEHFLADRTVFPYEAHIVSVLPGSQQRRARDLK